jgi:hypothetical protein
VGRVCQEDSCSSGKPGRSAGGKMVNQRYDIGIVISQLA